MKNALKAWLQHRNLSPNKPWPRKRRLSMDHSLAGFFPFCFVPDMDAADQEASRCPVSER